MISKKLFRYLFTLLFILSASNIKAQQHEVDLLGLQTIQFNSDDNFAFFDGEIHLKNNETLKGRISLNHLHNNIYSTSIRTKDGCSYIPNTTIDNVVLYKNERYKQVETRFIPIEGYSKLFREVFKKDNKTAIYDLLEKPFDGKILSGVYVKENDTMEYVYNFWSSGPKKDLINYINKRDNKAYKRRDFKTLESLFAAL